jgi:hypothetical protein
MPSMAAQEAPEDGIFSNPGCMRRRHLLFSIGSIDIFSFFTMRIA